MAVHQCANFFNNPRLVHERAVRCIAKYLARISTPMNLIDGKQQLSTGSKSQPIQLEVVVCI